MKKIFFTLTSLILCLCFLFSVTASAEISAADSPKYKSEANLKWSLKLGSDYKTSPSVPVVCGNYVYTMSGTSLLKLDTATGSTVSSAQMKARPNFGYTPVLCDADSVYCPLSDATIEAFSSSSLSEKWTYKDSLGGQSLTPIVCDSGRIYTGFWNNNDADANFVCLSASDGTLLWSFTHKGGFYWSECAVAGNYIIIAGDDGTASDSAPNKIYCLNALTGAVMDSADITGDIRSGIAYSNNNLFFVSKAGYLYKTEIDINGQFNAIKYVSLGGASTSTPAIYNNRIYVGVQTNGFKSGKVSVYDSSALSLITSADMPGYPQSEILISTCGTSPVIYTTCNGDNGGLTALTYSENGSLNAEEIFTPESGYTGYCISIITAGNDGTLYYKNDSGTIFAVSKGNEESQGSSSLAEIISSIFQRIITLIKLLLSIVVL